MLWIIYCIDKPNTAETRAKVLQQHRAYLETQKGIIVLAGPTQSDDGAQSIGSVFILNVNSRAEAKAFSDGDPFTQSGIFANITIQRMRKGPWHPAVGDTA